MHDYIRKELDYVLASKNVVQRFLRSIIASIKCSWHFRGKTKEEIEKETRC